MSQVGADVDAEAARTAFSGVVRVDRHGAPELEAAYGLADRPHAIAMTTAHQLGTASVTKGFTALTVLSLVADGSVELTTTARSVLGPDLPLVDDEVTLEQLLSHRSGIGDYLDESTIERSDDYLMPVPVHQLASSEDYLSVLVGHRMVSRPGTVFEYNNGAFVVLALVAERVAQVPFHDLVEARVWRPAGMTGSAFLRSDELPATAAVGYLHPDGERTNVLHLPVRGSGDGGAYTTVGDISAFWDSLLSGRIVPQRWVDEMRLPRRAPEGGRLGYGLGLWLWPTGVLELHGYDAGVSFRTMHDPATSSTWTVGSNQSEGTGPIEPLLEADLPS